MGINHALSKGAITNITNITNTCSCSCKTTTGAIKADVASTLEKKKESAKFKVGLCERVCHGDVTVT